MQFSGERSQRLIPVTVAVTVTALRGDQVTVAGNRPLAGETLHFAVEITGVREATVDELMHGRVAVAGGQAHWFVTPGRLGSTGCR